MEEKIPTPFSFSGRVLATFKGERELLKVLYTNPLYHKASLLLGIFTIPTNRNALDAIYEAVFNSKIEGLLSPSISFGARCVRKGFHPFTSQEVAAYAGAAVIDACRIKRGFRPKVYLDDPDLIVNADVVQDRLLLGVELVGQEGLHHRRWRIYSHPAGLKSTLANALLFVAGLSLKDILWDPMCGSGTIPIEAAHRLIGLPAGFFRKNEFLFLRNSILSSTLWDQTTKEVDSLINWDAPITIYASDHSPKHLSGAIANAQKALVVEKIKFFKCDVSEFPHKESISLIAANPPYGVRLGSPHKAENTLKKALISFAESSATVFTLLYPELERVESEAKKLGIRLDKALNVYNGNLRVWLVRLAKN